MWVFNRDELTHMKVEDEVKKKNKKKKRNKKCEKFNFGGTLINTQIPKPINCSTALTFRREISKLKKTKDSRNRTMYMVAQNRNCNHCVIYLFMSKIEYIIYVSMLYLHFFFHNIIIKYNINII
jgi:hypothetical protein